VTIVRRFPAGILAVIALGGAAGAELRAALEQALPATGRSFPATTFAVNMVGSALLGVVVVVAMERGAPSRYFRPLLATGFCGGLTTFSTLAVETDRLIKHGASGMAALYLTASVAGGLVAARLGMVVARWI
jgi:CrcB protein